MVCHSSVPAAEIVVTVISYKYIIIDKWYWSNSTQCWKLVLLTVDKISPHSFFIEFVQLFMFDIQTLCTPSIKFNPRIVWNRVQFLNVWMTDFAESVFCFVWTFNWNSFSSSLYSRILLKVKGKFSVIYLFLRQIHQLFYSVVYHKLRLCSPVYFPQPKYTLLLAHNLSGSVACVTQVFFIVCVGWMFKLFFKTISLWRVHFCVSNSHRVNEMGFICNFHFVMPFRYLNLRLKLVIYTALLFNKL